MAKPKTLPKPRPAEGPRLSTMPIGPAVPVTSAAPTAPIVGAPPKLTGRENAVTRGQGKKIGLRATLAGIKARGIAAGYKPSQADVVATYRRSMAKRKLAKPRA